MGSRRASAKRPKSRRAPGRARRAAILVLTVVVVAAAAWFGIREEGDPRFALGELGVSGVHRARAEDVISAAGFTPGANVWLLDVRGAVTRIESNPWIRTASVRRRWPNRVTIAVTERQPAALIRLLSAAEDPADTIFALVDAQLDVLQVGPQDPRDAALPVLGVVPLPPSASQPGANLQATAAASALSAVQQLSALGLRFSEIDVAPELGISAVTAGSLRVVFGDTSALKEKVAEFSAISPHIRDPRAVKYVDVRSLSTPTVLYR